MENKDLQKEFEAAARPMRDFIKKYGHPHCTAIITMTTAEMLEGQIAYQEIDEI